MALAAVLSEKCQEGLHDWKVDRIDQGAAFPAALQQIRLLKGAEMERQRSGRQAELFANLSGRQPRRADLY